MKFKIYTAIIVILTVIMTIAQMVNREDVVLPEVVKVVLHETGIKKKSPIQKMLGRDLSDQEEKCLALNIFHEAGVESHEGKVAVGQVTLNRVRSGRWGDDLCEVVYAKAQFSWTLWEKNHRVMPTGPLWDQALVASHAILEGEKIAALDNTLFYHTDYIRKPRWADDKHRSAVIGQHIFYTKAKMAPSKKPKNKKTT